MKKYRLFHWADTLRGRLIQAVSAAVLSAAAVWFFTHLTAYRCPLRWIVGISCPGCGMTRAASALLRLDVPSALAYHPLVFFTATFAVVMAAAWVLHPPVLRLRWPWILLAVMFGLHWCLRIRLFFQGQDPAFFEPDAMIPTIIKGISRLMSHSGS